MASSAPDHLRTPGLISNRPFCEGIKIWAIANERLQGVPFSVLQHVPLSITYRLILFASSSMTLFLFYSTLLRSTLP